LINERLRPAHRQKATFDYWNIARKRLKSAQRRLVELHQVIAETARHLDDWINIKAGQLEDSVNVVSSIDALIVSSNRLSGIKGKWHDGRQGLLPSDGGGLNWPGATI
jgi:hypothetical protein